MMGLYYHTIIILSNRINSYNILYFRTIVSANIQKLLNKAVGEQKANKVDEMLGVLGGQWAKNTAAESILPMIASKIQEKLPEKMSEQFEQKGLKCTITVKPENEQADYFYTVIESLD